MPTSKKQLVKLNQAKKAKAEELSKQAASGSQEAKKKLKKLEKKLKWAFKKKINLFYLLLFFHDRKTGVHTEK